MFLRRRTSQGAADAATPIDRRLTAPKRPGSRYLMPSAAAAASAAACLLAAVVGAVPAAGLAAASTLLILGTLVADLRRQSPQKTALLRQASESAETGRRLAIYERETGLLAYWYASLRGDEECDRAARYKRPLTLLLAEPKPESDARVVQAQLADWARRQVRAVDIAGYLGNGRILVLMPETDGTGAWRVVARLHTDVPGIETGLSRLPADGVTFEKLYAVASERLGEQAGQAA